MTGKSSHSLIPTSLPLAGLSALGIVFGDIGTSPLYTLKTVLALTGENPDTRHLGALSLVIWTLIVVTTIKYVSVAMRVDNDGEGGILALMALLGVKRQRRPVIVALGLFGAALIYGDGAITPAISVLSALEGLNIATPAVQPYIVPAAVAILMASVRGPAARVPRASVETFGPIMAIWFLIHRRSWHRRDCATPRRTVGDQSVVWLKLSVIRRHRRLSGAWWRLSLRHRSGGSLC